MNDIIKQAHDLASTHSMWDLVGLSSDDGRRPDGITVFQFLQGKSQMWDATSVIGGGHHCLYLALGSHPASPDMQPTPPGFELRISLPPSNQP